MHRASKCHSTLSITVRGLAGVVILKVHGVILKVLGVNVIPKPHSECLWHRWMKWHSRGYLGGAVKTGDNGVALPPRWAADRRVAAPPSPAKTSPSPPLAHANVLLRLQVCLQQRGFCADAAERLGGSSCCGRHRGSCFGRRRRSSWGSCLVHLLTFVARDRMVMVIQQLAYCSCSKFNDAASSQTV